MKRFTTLFDRLEQSGSGQHSAALLAEYFDSAPDEDKVWAMALLSDNRPRRVVTLSLLREWAVESSNLPLWLFEESYRVVGDLSETIALLNTGPSSGQPDPKSLSEWMDQLTALKHADDDERKQCVIEAWKSMSCNEKFVFNKLITGSFRLRVSRVIMAKALAQHCGYDENALMVRIASQWDPQNISFVELISCNSSGAENSKPYPFCLAHEMQDGVGELENPGEWQVERKWDAMRGQLIKRAGAVYTWSEEEDLVTDKFPEFNSLGSHLPDGIVIDGDILTFRDGIPLSYQYLQKRIARKNINKKLLKDEPVVMVAYDLMEYDGRDVRDLPLTERRELLEKVAREAGHPNLMVSPVLKVASWKDVLMQRADSRTHHAEGLMLRLKNGTYVAGRKESDWLQWKADPLTLDAVLIYAVRGEQQHSGQGMQYTFAVWSGEELIPFTRTSSDLTEAERSELDLFVQQNTIERFGPVRSIRPELVFEITFDGIVHSARHKSGIALRFPRMGRWLKDKPAAEANTLKDLKELLNLYG